MHFSLSFCGAFDTTGNKVAFPLSPILRFAHNVNKYLDDEICTFEATEWSVIFILFYYQPRGNRRT